ncbi:hypothetical protein [Ferviditalea candida]|uniref:Uncharacterized protein n=1 Tax=Ferviditalea candida TaxID=3108399 RepID=A0ABU5ZEM5_9BACL|nr:hypothetical protein [Paenibacillaceae bacterium T2]
MIKIKHSHQSFACIAVPHLLYTELAKLASRQEPERKKQASLPMRLAAKTSHAISKAQKWQAEASLQEFT